jgi:hypothetical protein
LYLFLSLARGPFQVSAGKEKKEAKAARRAHVLPLVENDDFERLLKMDELTREVTEVPLWFGMNMII